MDDATAFRRASDNYVRLAREVSPSQWAATTPCAEWDVRALVNHVAGEYLWVPELLAGRTIADVGSRLDGDLLGDDPLEALVNAARDAQAAAREDDALTRVVHLSFGDVPGAEYLKQMAVDSVFTRGTWRGRSVRTRRWTLSWSTSATPRCASTLRTGDPAARSVRRRNRPTTRRSRCCWRSPGGSSPVGSGDAPDSRPRSTRPPVARTVRAELVSVASRAFRLVHGDIGGANQLREDGSIVRQD